MKKASYKDSCLDSMICPAGTVLLFLMVPMDLGGSLTFQGNYT